ncbi:MAG: hypothetical protein RL033_5204, partial [Pseudomonadota bacterium]
MSQALRKPGASEQQVVAWLPEEWRA